MPFSFLHLPLEIRQKIYQELFERKWTHEEWEERTKPADPSNLNQHYLSLVQTTGPTLHTSSDTTFLRPCLPLLLTCKQIHAEAHHLPLTLNTFRLTIVEYEHMAFDIAWNSGARILFLPGTLLSKLTPGQRGYIANVYVEFYTPCVLDYNKSIWHTSFKRELNARMAGVLETVGATGVRALSVWFRTDCYEAYDAARTRPGVWPAAFLAFTRLAFDPCNEASEGRAKGKHVSERTITVQSFLDPLKSLGKLGSLRRVGLLGAYVSAEYVREFEDALLGGRSG